MWNKVPSSFPSPVLDISNQGVMRDSVMWIRGGTGSLAGDRKDRYDQNPAFDRLFNIETAANIGIRFGADTGNAAILFTQPDGRTQPLVWWFGNAANRPPSIATLTVAGDTGEFNFTGNGVRVNGP